MLIISLLSTSELLLRSPFQNLKQALPIIINRVNQVNSIIDKPLFDHIIQKRLTGERRTGIDLNQPALEILIENNIKSVQIKAIRIERNVVLRSDQRLKADLLDLVPNLGVPVDFQVLCERLAECGQADF